MGKNLNGKAHTHILTSNTTFTVSEAVVGNEVLVA